MLYFLGFHDNFRLPLQEFIKRFVTPYFKQDITLIPEVHADPKIVNEELFNTKTRVELEARLKNAGLNTIMAANLADYYDIKIALAIRVIPCVSNEPVNFLDGSSRDIDLLNQLKEVLKNVKGNATMPWGSQHARYAFINYESNEKEYHDLRSEQAIINPDYLNSPNYLNYLAH